MSEIEFDYEAALLACAAGKRQALSNLYQQEGARLMAVVYRIVRNHALAEEIVHDAFIKIWQNSHRYSSQLGAARGWIYTLTRNLALNAIDKDKRQITAEPGFLTDLLDQQQSGANESNLNEAEQNIEKDALHDCIQQLNEQSKQCILHAYIDGYTQEEIATLMEKPLGTIKTWVRRSLTALKECLQ